MKLWDVLLAYQGIIGTLLGVITTIFTSTWLKKFGKVHASAQNYKVSYNVQDSSGYNYYINSHDPEHRPDEYLHGKLEIELAMFNGSEEHKGLKNIRICLLDGKGKEVFKNIPRDQRTSRILAGAHHTDEVKVINLPPKIMVYYDLSIIVDKSGLMELKKCERVTLEAEDHRGRQKRMTIIAGIDLELAP